MTNGPEMLVLRGITKSFAGATVVDNLSLSIRKGEFVSILGPSGCGKTTTLRIVAGFMQPDRGELLLGGERIDNVPSHRRGAAMVFQNYALFPHLTVFDNVAFGPRMHKVPRAEVNRKVEKALELVRLPQLGSRYPRQLSGGQQQRVALARAIALDPKLLLLDEPLSNLDAKLRKELRAEFLEIHRLSGITTLFVTHDIEEAFSVSDRVAVMNHGRLEQFDTPVAIYTRPRTRFVADFVGHANIVEGPLVCDATGAPSLQFGGALVRLPRSAPARITGHFAIPSHLLSIGAKAPDKENCFPARLASLAYLGPTVQFQVRIADHTFHGEAHASADLLALQQDDEVYVSWRSADMIEIDAGAA
ncbi:MAG TPA: ABC transporter ATP-binding protein [Casimicrobiaceae bacterium]|nr:ABC transporter ATP-binding protein [Casimicrobiaceae bacterium]